MKADTSNGRPFLGRLIEINEEGSMIIPKDLLEYAGITEGSQVEVIGTSESLVLKQLRSVAICVVGTRILNKWACSNYASVAT